MDDRCSWCCNQLIQSTPNCICLHLPGLSSLSVCWPRKTYKNCCLKKTQPLGSFGCHCFYVGSAFPPSSRALLLTTIPTQPYPHSLLQRHQILKSPPPRSSSAVMWDPMAFAQSTASVKSSAPLECLRLRKVRCTFYSKH